MIVALPGHSRLFVVVVVFCCCCCCFVCVCVGGGGSFISCGYISITRAIFLTLAKLACSNVTGHNTHDLSPALINLTESI